MIRARENDIPRGCEHLLTEILDTTERIEDGGLVVSRTEACRMCGQRRTVTERGSLVSSGPWGQFRFRITP